MEKLKTILISAWTYIKTNWKYALILLISFGYFIPSINQLDKLNKRVAEKEAQIKKIEGENVILAKERYDLEVLNTKTKLSIKKLEAQRDSLQEIIQKKDIAIKNLDKSTIKKLNSVDKFTNAELYEFFKNYKQP